MTTGSDSLSSLNNARFQAADSAFERYDFGTKVEEVDGWEYSGNEMTRAVYILRDEEPEGPSEHVHFTVRFGAADSSVVAEAYAITGKGVIFGK